MQEIIWGFQINLIPLNISHDGWPNINDKIVIRQKPNGDMYFLGNQRNLELMRTAYCAKCPVGSIGRAKRVPGAGTDTDHFVCRLKDVNEVGARRCRLNGSA